MDLWFFCVDFFVFMSLFIQIVGSTLCIKTDKLVSLSISCHGLKSRCDHANCFRVSDLAMLHFFVGSDQYLFTGNLRGDLY